MKLGPVQPESPDRDQDPASLRVRPGDLAYMQRRRWSGSVEDHRFHGRTSRLHAPTLPCRLGVMQHQPPMKSQEAEGPEIRLRRTSSGPRTPVGLTGSGLMTNLLRSHERGRADVLERRNCLIRSGGSAPGRPTFMRPAARTGRQLTLWPCYVLSTLNARYMNLTLIY